MTMAERPVFTTTDQSPYYAQIDTQFRYFSGFSVTQKQRSVESLHAAFLQSHPKARPLEISTKSADPVGAALSAFHLKVRLASGAERPLEAVFQGAKVFEGGGPYEDLLERSARDAKTDPRLQTSGKLVSFRLEGRDFDTEPRTFFYDWLYVSAVAAQPRLLDRIVGFDAFTDIEFNPKRSVNCQARSAAILVSLARKGMLKEALASPDAFLHTVYGAG